MSGRTIALIQARMGSTRLPGKVLADLGGQPMLVRQIERVRRARLLDGLFVATTIESGDDAIAALCAREGVGCHRGSTSDVLGRFHDAAERFGPADHIVRLTGDCPLTDPALVDACIALHLANGADYTSNVHPRTYPDGLDIEVMTAGVLARMASEAGDATEREHVTPFIHRRPGEFARAALQFHRDCSGLRWTVDRADDLAFVRAVFDALHARTPLFGWRDVLALVESEPTLAAINGG